MHKGHCGPPLPCNVVKLVDVPEMDYYAKDNKGEVGEILSTLSGETANIFSSRLSLVCLLHR